MVSDKHVLVLLLFLWLQWCSSCTVRAPNQHSLAVSPFAKLKLSHGLPANNSPSLKLGTLMVCERVHIHGLSRVKDLRKFAHSVMVKVSGRSSSVYFPKAEVCFHRSISLVIGMCPDKKWETISNGSWVRSASPFGRKLLDIEFALHRVIYLVLGIVMMSLASLLSHSLVFYYGSSMASGVILVILVAFFQGMKKAMKLLPTGPKTSLLIYSSTVGFLSFLLYYFRASWRSLLTEARIDEVFSYALGVFLLASVILDGVWLGFWVVRKFIQTEDGSVDIKTAQFVAWSVRISAALLILQSSVDAILAMEALVFGITVSSMLTRMFRLRFVRCIYRNLRKLAKRKHRMLQVPDSLASEDSLDDGYMYKILSNEDFGLQSRSKKFTDFPSTPAYHGFKGNDSSQLYISSFHTTPERRKLSRHEWEKFTRDSTEKAVEDLVSSPDFGRWVSKNAGRIMVTPPSGARAEQRHKWFLWS